MKAITYQSLGEIQNSELTNPTADAYEVVVRVHASGICHTDIDILYGRYGNSTFPLVPGHEYAGEVVEVCLLYTSPSPRDATLSRMPSSA